MVGGKVIDITRMSGGVKLWTCSHEGETCVHVEEDDAMGLPAIGAMVWWQEGKVYFDSDRRWLKKLGFSHDPHSCGRSPTP